MNMKIYLATKNKTNDNYRKKLIAKNVHNNEAEVIENYMKEKNIPIPEIYNGWVDGNMFIVDIGSPKYLFYLQMEKDETINVLATQKNQKNEENKNNK